VYALLRRAVDVRPEEVRALLLSFAFFFCVLAGYFVLRPIRDDMGIAGGVQNLAYLYTGTLGVMLLANPLFSALVTRLPVRRLLPLSYRFFMANLVMFFVVLNVWPGADVWTGRVFFVWTSVANLFFTAIFWAFMADRFQPEQGKRLFAFIGVGGTLGAIFGSTITATLAGTIGRVNLLLVSVLLLEAGVQCALRFPASFRAGERGTLRDAVEDPIGGSAWANLTNVVRSPYLIGIAGFMLLTTLGSTSLYFHQAEILREAFQDRAARTALLARIDLTVNVLVVLTQAFVTARLLRWLGVGFTLAILPLVSIVAFSALGAAPVLTVVVGVYVIRRATGFAIGGPAREVLFTVLPREDKYKAKSFIDTFVWRVGDQVGAWTFALLLGAGVTQSAIAWAMVPLSGAWLVLAVWLGRRQSHIAARA
jgi:ATP:ADP antiporter, AAA family